MATERRRRQRLSTVHQRRRGHGRLCTVAHARGRWRRYEAEGLDTGAADRRHPVRGGDADQSALSTGYAPNVDRTIVADEFAIDEKSLVGTSSSAAWRTSTLAWCSVSIWVWPSQGASSID